MSRPATRAQLAHRCTSQLASGDRCPGRVAIAGWLCDACRARVAAAPEPCDPMLRALAREISGALK